MIFSGTFPDDHLVEMIEFTHPVCGSSIPPRVKEFSEETSSFFRDFVKASIG